MGDSLEKRIETLEMLVNALEKHTDCMETDIWNRPTYEEIKCPPEIDEHWKLDLESRLKTMEGSIEDLKDTATDLKRDIDCCPSYDEATCQPTIDSLWLIDLEDRLSKIEAHLPDSDEEEEKYEPVAFCDCTCPKEITPGWVRALTERMNRLEQDNASMVRIIKRLTSTEAKEDVSLGSEDTDDTLSKLTAKKRKQPPRTTKNGSQTKRQRK